MPFRWLNGDDTHPVRPDLPVFRHLTFTEVHALELGIYVGLLAYFAVEAGYEGEIITLLIGIVRFTISDGKAKASTSKVAHRMGFHDVRQEPSYFGAGFLLAYGLAVLGDMVFALLETGVLA